MVDFAKAKKTLVTDKDGVAEKEEFKNGKDVITAKYKGVEVLTQDVVIKKSTTNVFNLEIESL